MSSSLHGPKAQSIIVGGLPESTESDELLVTAADVARATIPVLSDRQRLLDAASTLISAIEAIRTARDMQALRGDLNMLQHEAEHVRRVVDGQSAICSRAQLSF